MADSRFGPPSGGRERNAFAETGTSATAPGSASAASSPRRLESAPRPLVGGVIYVASAGANVAVIAQHVDLDLVVPAVAARPGWLVRDQVDAARVPLDLLECHRDVGGLDVGATAGGSRRHPHRIAQATARLPTIALYCDSASRSLQTSITSTSPLVRVVCTSPAALLNEGSSPATRRLETTLPLSSSSTSMIVSHNCALARLAGPDTRASAAASIGSQSAAATAIITQTRPDAS